MVAAVFEQISFAHPWALLALLLVPLTAWLLFQRRGRMLTLDYRVLQELLDQVRTGVIVDGTAIGNALATAVNRLRESDAKSKVIILLTDGDNNAGNISPLQAAQIAKDQGIKVFTIVIGKGGRVPYPTGTDLLGRTLYEQVEIEVNPALLQEIAKTTGGAAYLATDRQS